MTVKEFFNSNVHIEHELTEYEYSYSGDGMRPGDNVRTTTITEEIVTDIVLPPELGLNAQQFIGQSYKEVYGIVMHAVRKHLLGSLEGKQFGQGKTGPFEINGWFEVTDKYGNFLMNIPNDWEIGDFDKLNDLAIEAEIEAIENQ